MADCCRKERTKRAVKLVGDARAGSLRIRSRGAPGGGQVRDHGAPAAAGRRVCARRVHVVHPPPAADTTAFFLKHKHLNLNLTCY